MEVLLEGYRLDPRLDRHFLVPEAQCQFADPRNSLGLGHNIHPVGNSVVHSVVGLVGN